MLSISKSQKTLDGIDAETDDLKVLITLQTEASETVQVQDDAGHIEENELSELKRILAALAKMGERKKAPEGASVAHSNKP
jgi:hypothetical protein